MPVLMRLLAALGLAALLAGCSRPQLSQQESYVFGTRVQISIWGLEPEVAQRHGNAVLAELDRLHGKLHAWQPSAITRLNTALAAGKSAPVDIELRDMLRQAADYEQRSDGLFAPGIGGLVAAWGFHAEQFSPQRPADAVLRNWVQAQPRLADLDIGDTTISSRNPAVQIDLGGFAKGWALDHAADYLRRHRVRNALINIGGNVLALGQKDGQPWKVGIQHPRRPEAMAVLALNDGEAIGTSGDYQRYFLLDGQRYSHLLDPRSGQPAQGVQAATVVVPASTSAGAASDAATKPLFIAGPASAATYLTRFGIQDALIVTADAAYVSRSLQPRLSWTIRPQHLYSLR